MEGVADWGGGEGVEEEEGGEEEVEEVSRGWGEVFVEPGAHDNCRGGFGRGESWFLGDVLRRS